MDLEWENRCMSKTTTDDACAGLRLSETTSALRRARVQACDDAFWPPTQSSSQHNWGGFDPSYFMLKHEPKTFIF